MGNLSSGWSMSATKNTMLANEGHLKERCEYPKRVITNARSALLLSAVSVPVLEILISYRVTVCRWIWFRQDGIRPGSSAGLSCPGYRRLLRSQRRNPCRLPLAGLSWRLLLHRKSSMVCATESQYQLVVVCLIPGFLYGIVVR